MRYYVIGNDGYEVCFDLANATRKASGVVSFEVQTEEGKKKNYYMKSLAGKQYLSEDEISWKKVAKINSANSIVNINDSLDIYRGFKPSGIGGGSAGELITDMPGKVVKILTKEGEEVKQGETLLILEAMKMENEIKAGLDGTVKTINVTEGQNLDSGHLMIEIEE